MKKIIVSLAAIVAVAAVAGYGSWAYFYDEEASDNNTVQAGTLDLVFGVGTAPISVSNVAPGDSGNTSIDLTNSGSLPGELDLRLNNVTNYACDSAQGKDDGTEYCTVDAGVLDASLDVAIYLDNNENAVFDAGDLELLPDGAGLVSAYDAGTNNSLNYSALSNFNNDFWNAVKTMTAGENNDDLVLQWQVNSAAPNTAQGDAVDFDLAFILEQSARD